MTMHRSLFLLLTTCLFCCKQTFSFVSLRRHQLQQRQPILRWNHQKNSPETFSTPSSTTTTTTTKNTGQSIQQAQSKEDLFSVPLWLPTDDNLPPHFRSQHIHHEKRQRWSAQWLTRLMELQHMNNDNDNNNNNNSKKKDDSSLWQTESFERAVLAAALPYNETPTTFTRKETQAIRQSLVALHTLLRTNVKTGEIRVLSPKITSGIRLLIQRAEQMAFTIPLNEAIEVRWAARGLIMVAAASFTTVPCPMDDLPRFLAVALPQLEDRVSRLPFDILPRGVPFHNNTDPISSLQQDIPFQFDTIVTRTGSSVRERRGTAWVAQEGIGALAYSGKLMAPHPLPASVESIMRQVEYAIGKRGDLYGIGKKGDFFDCALCNFYPNGESACKFHTDPEHGTVWDRLTCVVAAGDARRFAFRPIETSWADWEYDNSSPQKNGATNEPAVIRLFPGDIVLMHGTCNDDFHHAVYPDADGDGRISLVLKRALSRGSKGQRGHGLVGEGRRSRRKR